MKRKWQTDIENGTLVTASEPTLASVALAYMKSGGARRFLVPLLKHFGERPLKLIDQDAVEANALYPNGCPATRNRHVYTPVSAILKYGNVNHSIRRPKGAQGQQLIGWLWPEQAHRLLNEALKLDTQFGIFCATLCYTGLRLNEALSILVKDVRLDENFAFLPTSKNGEARPVYLLKVIVEAIRRHPKGLNGDGRLFTFTDFCASQRRMQT